MDSIQVRRSIKTIYDRFLIPRNLRLHMYRVASVAEMVCDNLNGITVDKDDVAAVCLLHDVGNIVKFDLETESSAGLLGEDAKNRDYWMRVRKDTVARYGASDHEATHNMLAELGVDEKTIRTIDGMGIMFDPHHADAKSDYEIDICNYSDLRVSPNGILSVTDRAAEFCDRCSKSGNEAMRARGLALAASMDKILEMEKRIFSGAGIRPEQINDKSIKPYLDKYTQ